VTKTEGDNDGAGQNQDDNYHFLMSLLPYLREVPKNRKMVIRHKLQRVFVEEQERKSGGRNINANHPDLNNCPTPFPNMFMPYPLNQPQQTPRVPPPPYPFKQDVVYNRVPSTTKATASVPMPNARASTSTLLGNLIAQQPPIFPKYPVSVDQSSGHQQYYNATANNNANNNNSSFGYNAISADNNNAINNNISSFSYNTTTLDNNNANNNNSIFGYNATTVNNNNANNNNNNNSFGYNATNMDKNNANNNNNNSFSYNNNANNNNSSFLYNATVMDNDNGTFTYQSEVTGEPPTFTYLQ